MGRQIAIAATPADELSFLNFVRTTAEIRLAESAAPSVDDLWVDGFSEHLSIHRQYWIWNTSFDWIPKYGRVNADAPGTGGWHYIENINHGPVVEFWRSDWSKPAYCRLYWPKYFAAPNGLNYDVQAFSAWYDRLVRWVRKNGKKVVSGSYEPYFLPDAWARKVEQK